MSMQLPPDYAEACAHAAGSGKEHRAHPSSRKRSQALSSESTRLEGNRTIKSSKSRTGCGFCKQKRLKCDETKPECKNCLNRDHKCPGYKQVYQWKAKCQSDVRSFDAALRKKTVAQRSIINKEQPRGKPSKCDDHEKHVQESTQETTGQKGSDKASEAHNAEVHHGFDDLGDLGGMDSGQNWMGIDLDGFSVGDVIGTSYCDNLPDIDHSQDPNTTFPMGQASLSLCGYPSTDTTLIEQPQMPAEIDPADLTMQISRQGSMAGAKFSDALSRRKDIRGLLRKFYATSPSIPFPLVHHATKLVEHYFSKICGIYSCFDSFLNPFRYTVSQSWSHSASTYYAIQSMAAAHLGNELPLMRKEGLDLHRKASQHLGQEVQRCRFDDSSDDQALLSLLLLGMSACWQRPGDLGLPYLRTARGVMYRIIARHSGMSGSTTMRPLLQFFEEAMVYWEMVTSFVADEIEIDVVQPYPSTDHVRIDNVEESPCLELPPIINSSELLPHPWTGVSPESQMLLGQVGRLVRRARVHGRCLENGGHLFGLALELEESLLAAASPNTGSMTDCGDLVTQNTDFITLAETTRDAGLLELYRVFPGLLQRRLGPDHDADDGMDGENDPGALSASASRSWLTSLALHILRRLELIPDSSNVRCHQLLLIVIAAAELRLPSLGKINHAEFSDLDLEVLWGRQFARAKLHQLAIQLPAQPVYTILELITEVWRRIDASSDQRSDDTFWIDVMVEKGWHTVMG